MYLRHLRAFSTGNLKKFYIKCVDVFICLSLGPQQAELIDRQSARLADTLSSPISMLNTSNQRQSELKINWKFGEF